MSYQNQAGSALRRAGSLICAAAALALLPVQQACADSLEAISLAPGYSAQSIELGQPFGGAIAQDPVRSAVIYVSVGNYAAHSILSVNSDTGTTRALSPVIGNVGGLAVLTNGDLVITENLTSETILRARDLDADGAYFSPGEITELIAPAHVTGTFSGAQMAIAPAANGAGLSVGALLVQTADGSDQAEILAIQNPDSTPSYLPADAPWFGGFMYNGGIAFTPAGNVLCGISEFPVGRIMALVNANANDRIDAGEAHEIVSAEALENSLSDIAASADGRLLTTENSGLVRWFDLPENLAGGTVQTSGILAVTNAGYLSTARLRQPAQNFRPSATGQATTLLVGGYVTFPAATNLLAISPTPAPAAAKGWTWLE